MHVQKYICANYIPCGGLAERCFIQHALSTHFSLPCPLMQKTHYNPLLVAAAMNHTKTVETLLEGGAHVNHQDEVSSEVFTVLLQIWNYFFPQQSGHTALWWAAKRGHVEVVQLLLQHHADISICNVVCV